MSWEPILAFPNESPDFAHGFEAGRVWQALHEDTDALTFTVHGANVELMLRIAERLERTIEWGDVDETWATVTFGPTQ